MPIRMGTSGGIAPGLQHLRKPPVEPDQSTLGGFPLPTNSPFIGINPNSDDYAAQVNAAIARADWSRYQEQYQPLEDLLLSRVGNDDYQRREVSKNLNRFNNGFSSGVDSYQRNLGRYGLTLSKDEQSSFNRMVDQSRSLGKVETINRTNRDLEDQEYQIIGAGTRPVTSTGNN